MHHIESMPSLHVTTTSPNDPFPTSPPASPLSFTTTPSSIPDKRSRHTHRRSLAISSHLTFPTRSVLEQNTALITPPLSSPALSFPKPASLESLRSGNSAMEYDSDVLETPILDDESVRDGASIDAKSPYPEQNDDLVLPDVETVTDETPELESAETLALPVKLRKVAFNDAIVYYPPRPLSSRQASFSSQISQHSSRESTPLSAQAPVLSHRRSLSSFLLPSPTFHPSHSTSPQRHTRDRKSWAGLITSPFTRRRSPNRYRPPTPPLGRDLPTFIDHDYRSSESWTPPTPIIDLDAALGPFQTPGSPLPSNHSSKFWSVTSHVGTHRRSESAPEIRGLGLDASPFNNDFLVSRGLKRKMSVIDEDDTPEVEVPMEEDDEMDIDDELHRIMLEEGEEMGEMGDLVVDETAMDKKVSKRRSWRKSLREWWKRV